MPKKTKTVEDVAQSAPAPDAPTAAKKTGKRQTPRRPTAAKTPRKPRKTSQKPAHISAAPEAHVTPAHGELSEDAVRLRTYFISERRRRFALTGDTESDWLEEKRQLLAEARR